MRRSRGSTPRTARVDALRRHRRPLADRRGHLRRPGRASCAASSMRRPAHRSGGKPASPPLLRPCWRWPVPPGTALPEIPACWSPVESHCGAKAITLSSRSGTGGRHGTVADSRSGASAMTWRPRHRRRACWRGRCATWPPFRARRSNRSTPASALDRRDAAVRARPRRPGRRGARRPAADPRRGRQLSRRHRVPACVAAATEAAASVVEARTRKWHDRCYGQLDYPALNATIRYLMFSVFSVRARCPGAEGAPGCGRSTSRDLPQAAGRARRGGARPLRRRRLRADADFMIWTARRTHRGAASHLTPTSGAPPRWAGPADAGVEQRRAAPAGRIQQEPHPGVPGR